MARRVLVVVLWLSAAALAHPSVSVVVDSKGNVFYSDLKQVWRVDRSGKKSVAVPQVHTHELWLDRSDNLYGEHLWYAGPQDGSGKWFHRVWRRSPDGSITDVVPVTEGFRANFSFVRDSAGNGYMAGEVGAADQTFIRVIGASGTPRLLAGGPQGLADGRGRDAAFSRIGWMSMGADGNLYVEDDGSVRRVTREGVVTTIARHVAEHSALAITVSRRHDLMGITADSLGNVYVAVYGARRIKKIGTDGRVTVFDRSTYPWSPTGITLAGGKAYVLESNGLNVRLRTVALK